MLVREARQMISQEIADNRKELDGVLADSDGGLKNLDLALRRISELLNAKKSDIRASTLGFSGADLSAASWQSAQRTGALGYMKYSEVQEYSRLYGVQDLYTEHQRRTLEQTASMIVPIRDPDSPTPPEDLKLLRRQVLALRAHLIVEEQLGRQLADIYRKTLEHYRTYVPSGASIPVH
jgi:hypothetical protein